MLADFDVSDDLPSQGRPERACALLKGALANGPVRSTDIRSLMQRESVSERMMMLAKNMLGIKSFRRGGVWYFAYKDKGRVQDAE